MDTRQIAARQSTTPTPRLAGLRIAIAAVVLLAACEVVILQLYFRAVQHVTELTVDLEYARGSAMMASAQALRCTSFEGK